MSSTKIRANQTDVEEILNDPSAGASDIKKGSVEIATQAEVNAGTDTLRVVTPNTLSNSTLFEPADATILKDADIGVTVQAYSANILFDGDIGVTVASQGHDHAGVYEPADATILKDADIGVTVAAQAHTHAIDDLSDVIITYGSPPMSGQVLKYNGVNWVNDTDSGLFTEDVNSNIFGGTDAGSILTTGTDNFFAGVRAGYKQNGSKNVAIGTDAMGRVSPNSLTTSVAIGFNAANTQTLSGSVSIGAYATGGTGAASVQNAVHIGKYAGTNSNAASGIFIGWASGFAISAATPMTGINNIGIGAASARKITTGDSNIGIGERALYGNASSPLTGNHNVALGRKSLTVISDSASFNTSIGGYAGTILTTGADNTIVGGYAAGNITTGSANVILGKSAGPTTNQSNQLFINNAESDTPLIGGTFATAAGSPLLTAQVTINGRMSSSTAAPAQPAIIGSSSNGTSGGGYGPVGVVGVNTSATGSTFGVKGQVTATTGTAGRFTNNGLSSEVSLAAGNQLIFATVSASPVFTVSNAGKLTITGGVDKLSTTGAAVDVASSPPPAFGQVLIATSGTAATWQAIPDGVTELGALNDVVLSGSPVPSVGDVLTFVAGSPSYWTNQAPFAGNNWLTAHNGANFGTPPSAAGDNAIAIGFNANASNPRNIALGWNSSATGGYDAFAVGRYASASSYNCIAIGRDSDATSTASVALGQGAQSLAGNTVAVGYKPFARGSFDIAIGRNSTTAAGKNSAIAIGNNSDTSESQSIAFGYNNNTLLANQVAIGSKCISTSVTSDVTHSVKLGHGLTGVNKNMLHLHSAGKLELYGASSQFVMPSWANAGSPAVDLPATADQGGVIYDSTTKNLLVYAGSPAGWSAVGVSNNWISGYGGLDFQVGATSAFKAFAAGYGSNANGNWSTAVGSNAKAFGSYSVALGSNAHGYADSALAIGRLASCTYNDAIAIGRSANTSGNRGMTIGNQSSCVGTFAASVGYNVDAGLTRQANFGIDIASTSVTTDVSHSVKLGYGAASVDKNMLYLHSKGKLELYGDEAQFVIPNYVLTGSPIAFPANTIEGGLIYDSTAKGLQVYAGSPVGWTVIGGGLFTEDASNNIVGGSGAGTSLGATAYGNFISGAGAAPDLTTGDDNIAIGRATLSEATTGGQNIAIGFEALKGNASFPMNSATGQNIAIGHQAANVLRSGATQNVCIGGQAGIGMIGPNGNTLIGHAAGVVIGNGGDNTIIGHTAGLSITSGSRNVCLGRTSGPTVNVSDKLFIDTSRTDTPLIGGDFSANTVDINGALSVVDDEIIFGDATINTAMMHLNNVASSMGFSSGTGINNGTQMYMYGPSHATSAYDFALKRAGSTLLLFDDSLGTWTLQCGAAGSLGDSVTFSADGVINSSGGVAELATATGIVSVEAAAAPTTGQVLTAGSPPTTAIWQTPSSGVAGIDTQLQYNNGGAFGGASNMTYNNANGLLSVTATTTGLPAIYATSTIAGTNSAGITGAASGASGVTYGVRGTTASPDGVGVFGLASVSGVNGVGVRGQAGGTAGTAIHGWAQGVLGKAGFFENTDGTDTEVTLATATNLIIGSVDGAEKFKVEDTGRTYVGGTTYASIYDMSLQSTATQTWLEILNNTGAGKGVFFGVDTNDFELWNYQGGTIQFFTAPSASNGIKRLEIETDGTLNVAGTTNYETLVTADDDIPNKKYVDDTVADTAMLMSVVFGI